jgi:hypothetical protein
MRAIVVVVALAGCATRTVVVAPGVVANSASELRDHGRAVVYAMDGKQAEIHTKDRVDVYVREGADLQKPYSLTLGEIAAGCESGQNKGSCIVERVVDQRLVVRHEHHVDSDLVAKGVGLLAIGGLTGYCLAECQDEGSVGRAFGYTAAVVGGTALLFVLAVALGGRD